MNAQRLWVLLALNLFALPINAYFAVFGATTDLRVLGLCAAVACGFTTWRLIRDPDSFS